MFQYDEHEQNLQDNGRHGEEVNRNHLTEVIAQERLPSLAGRPRQSPEHSGNSTFGNLDAEHCQLAVNPGCGPERVGSNHPFDQASNLDGAGSPSTAEPRTCETVHAAS
jgi:hypothetical protein